MPATLHEPATRWFLLLVVLGAVVYAALGLSPSSYGTVLDHLGAETSGPIAGTARDIRSDEWAILTPEFQIAVRNHFERINHSSFYHEDLRNYGALPLADWSLIFKPQMWAFFLLPPAAAFSIYFALFMAAFLCGLYLLFRQLEAPAAVSIAAALVVYFSGFAQFWWTTFLPMLAVFPWIALLVLRPMAAWKKGLIGLWAFPFFVLAHAYPPLLITLAWCTLFLVVAFRPALFRSPKELAALAAGCAAAVAVVYLYLIDVIPVMSNTVYPGHRLSPPGTTPLAAALSAFYPFLSFHLPGFANLTGENICEIGAVGSFLPIFTLCVTRFRELRQRPRTLRALAVLLAGFVMMTLWEVAPVPAILGRILLWDTSTSTRWLFASGFLLVAASLVIWRDGLVTLTPRRLVIFAFVGPVGSVLLKFAWLASGAETWPNLVSQSLLEIEAITLAAAGVLAIRPPASWRAPVVLAAIALLNIYGFGRFNPLQPSRPIFDVPDTPVLRALRADAAAAPDGLLVNPDYLGSTLNGLGFRSVNHYLLAPQLALFRRYFPAMDAARFNQVFNRSGHIQLMDVPLPAPQSQYVIGVPAEVFVPVSNLRLVEVGGDRAQACALPAGGEVTQVAENGGKLTLEGWAPWRSENRQEGIRVIAARPLLPGPMLTLTRPDIAERMQDYRFVKAGFRLELSSLDGKPLHAADVLLVAFETAMGESKVVGRTIWSACS